MGVHAVLLQIRESISGAYFIPQNLTAFRYTLCFTEKWVRPNVVVAAKVQKRGQNILN